MSKLPTVSSYIRIEVALALVLVLGTRYLISVCTSRATSRQFSFQFSIFVLCYHQASEAEVKVEVTFFLPNSSHSFGLTIRPYVYSPEILLLVRLSHSSCNTI